MKVMPSWLVTRAEKAHSRSRATSSRRHAGREGIDRALPYRSVTKSTYDRLQVAVTSSVVGTADLVDEQPAQRHHYDDG